MKIIALSNTVNKNIKKTIGILLLLSISVMGCAADEPATLLQKIADKMVSQLQMHQSELKKNPAIIRQIVDNTLMPYIDANRMAGTVVGRDAWYTASPANRKTFVDEFKKVVIGTYSDALASYNDDHVQVFPLRENSTDKKYVKVDSLIVRKSGQKIGISYNLIRTATSWQVYDFSIEGVSIVQNYQSQFASTLANGGIPALITQLKTYNVGHAS